MSRAPHCNACTRSIANYNHPNTMTKCLTLSADILITLTRQLCSPLHVQGRVSQRICSLSPQQHKWPKRSVPPSPLPPLPYLPYLPHDTFPAELIFSHLLSVGDRLSIWCTLVHALSHYVQSQRRALTPQPSICPGLPTMFLTASSRSWFVPLPFLTFLRVNFFLIINFLNSTVQSLL